MNSLESTDLLIAITWATLIIGGSSDVLAYHSGESCYELGTRYGRCSHAAMMGEQCRPEDDIVMPERCKGGTDSRRGIRDGLSQDKPTDADPYHRDPSTP
jgi:hypothetical protein